MLATGAESYGCRRAKRSRSRGTGEPRRVVRGDINVRTRIPALTRAAAVVAIVASAATGVSGAAVLAAGLATPPEPVQTGIAITVPSFWPEATSDATPGSGTYRPPVPAPKATSREAATLHVPILMYHVIATPAEARNDRPDLVVSPKLFDRQMDALWNAGWHTITLEAFAHYLHSGTPPPPKTFVLTIDDGRIDGFTHAAPILNRYGFPATYFVISGRIGNPGQMTAAQLRKLASAGNEIADHSATHIPLATDSPTDLARQICGAANDIARAAGRAPATFAYPFGSLDGQVVAAVRACPSILVAVTIRHGSTERWVNRLELPRLAVHPETTPADLLAMVEGAG